MIVIDMDMPKNCTDCPCLNSEYGYCQVDYKRMDRFNATKPKNCPIKCDIKQIRAEIDSYCSDNRDRNDGLYIAMRIIDKHTK